MTKLTPEQISEIRNSTKKVKELASLFNVSSSLILYHQSPDYRNKSQERQRKYRSKLTKEQKHKINVDRRDYMKNYMKRRYTTDEVFRKKAIQRAIRYKKRR